MTANQSPLQSWCGELERLAERELSAFAAAVAKLFGAEQAELAMADWLAEFESSDTSFATPRDMRRITVTVSHRLAMRVNGNGNGTTRTALELPMYPIPSSDCSSPLALL